jgi:hypothetical protein
MIASMDITPEHTARIMDNDLHPEVMASYAYVDRVSHTADIQAAPGIPAWHGWAIREAFLAGCSHAAAESQPEPEGHTPTPDDFRKWWRETGSASPGPSPEMLLTANAWAEHWAARCLQAQPEPEGVGDEDLEATARAAEVQNMKEQGGLTSPTPDGLSRQFQAQRLAGLRAIAYRYPRPTIQPVPQQPLT